MYSFWPLSLLNWYSLGVSPISIFRDSWFEGGGLTVEQLLNGPGYIPAFSVAIICSIIMAYVLAFIIIKTGDRTVLRSIKIGILVWFGFIATLLGTQYIFEARTISYFGITAGYPLLGLLIMSAIIGGWPDKKGE